jgi:hypothetical protein
MAELEIWQPIPGRNGYEASDLGRVRSIDKRVLLRNRWGDYRWRHYRGKMLKLVPTHLGYFRVKLGEHDNGADVHTLVMLAFRGPPPAGMIVRHLDNDGRNNRLSNLKYGTHAENYADAAATGKVQRGSRHYAAKLTEDQVREIRARTDTCAAIARDYGVSATTVFDIKRGHRWGWLK